MRRNLGKNAEKSANSTRAAEARISSKDVAKSKTKISSKNATKSEAEISGKIESKAEISSQSTAKGEAKILGKEAAKAKPKISATSPTQSTAKPQIPATKTPQSKANLAWGLVLLGGVVEIFWVSGLKHADSIALYALTVCGIGFSFVAMLVAVRYIEVSIAYAVFVGIGTVGVVLSEILVFGEAFSWVKIALIFVLLAAIIGLKFQATHHAHLKDAEFVRNLGDEMGLGEVLDGGKR